jgi:hypothetical protein
MLNTDLYSSSDPNFQPKAGLIPTSHVLGFQIATLRASLALTPGLGSVI